MPHRKLSHFIAFVVLVNLICWRAAHAQNIRSAVSLSGTDAATCTVPDPCRTFGVAISKTNAGGEVIVLSSAGYGPFTVDKSVSIISPNAFHAAIAPPTGTAITINAVGIGVVLRNLFLNSLGASIGIQVLNVAELNVESCTIAGFGEAGIQLTSSSDLFLSVKDSFLRGNGIGANLSPMGGVTRVTVDRTRIERSINDAFHVNPAASATVDSIIKESLLTSGFRGIRVVDSSTGTSSTNVESCVFVHNASIALSGGGASTRVIRVSQSYIANNGLGLNTNGGDDLRSFGNNRVQGNGTNGAFTSTIPLQ